MIEGVDTISIYVIGDLHLAFGVSKPMDIFSGWANYQERIEENWRANISDDDTVVIPGDVSWAMSLEEALPDFRFIESLSGKKLILKGNHDYWWTTMTKMEDFLMRNGLESIKILNNSSVWVGDIAICGSRGWLFEQGEAHDKKILSREANRLELSIKSSGDKEGERIVFLHYPPVFRDELSPEIIDVLLKYGIKRCFYGHIHGQSTSYALNGMYMGIDFRLISADFIGFNPVKVI